MKLGTVLQWLRLNLMFFAPFFLLTWMCIVFFPDAMLRVFGQWAVWMQAAGAKGAGSFATQSDMFTHILKTNGLTALIYTVIGLFLQSPLVMLFAGAFYAFTAFLAPHTIGRALGPNDWLLISVEVFTLILSISLSSALAGELFSVEPDAKSLLNYWKHNWAKLIPEPVSRWKSILREWSGTIATVLTIIVILLILVAWFEAYGY